MIRSAIQRIERVCLVRSLPLLNLLSMLGSDRDDGTPFDRCRTKLFPEHHRFLRDLAFPRSLPLDVSMHSPSQRYNQARPVLFTTYQMYRKDSGRILRRDYELSRKYDYWFACKVVIKLLSPFLSPVRAWSLYGPRESTRYFCWHPFPHSWSAYSMVGHSSSCSDTYEDTSFSYDGEGIGFMMEKMSKVLQLITLSNLSHRGRKLRSWSPLTT